MWGVPTGTVSTLGEEYGQNSGHLGRRCWIQMFSEVMWCGEAHKTLLASFTCVGRDKHHSKRLPTFLSQEITYFWDKMNNHFVELLLSQQVSSLPFVPALHPVVPQYHLWVLGYFWYCTWFIDGVGCLHASMDVIGHVAVQKPRSRVFCYEFNCLESPREKVIYISSVVLVCLWQSKARIVRVVPQIPAMGTESPVRLPVP